MVIAIPAKIEFDDFDCKKFLIPKGIDVGWYDSFNGCGSGFEMKTIRDFIIEPGKELFDGVYWEMHVDCDSTYSMKDTYCWRDDDFVDVKGVDDVR